ncbi:hypothetical protein OPKNFCMD_4033 [Methylobacterium crusticola]|uniref:Transcriptional regulator n=1 Tax=Methylobacterium crusticola TaxID=1697972 RepID=A0ABQ4R2A9_9HYPH|nr:hypothetical protein [Methylobacterium crusticola]GJD51279.1 hypothetical protein OPKNFCMD_4033 [Methylobacterium crusticola]
MTALTPTTAAKIAKVLPQLATDDDVAIVAAVAAMKRLLASGGHDIYDLTTALTAPLPTPRVIYREAPRPAHRYEESPVYGRWRHDLDPLASLKALVARCRMSSTRLSGWERGFLESVERQLKAGRDLSPKQKDVLFRIRDRLAERAA